MNGQTIHSIHDFDGNRIAEYLFNPATAKSTLLREYIWMNGLPVAVVENGQIYYIRTDHIGRPVYATDSTGAKVWEVSYLPFGGVHTSTGTPTNLRFPGQWFQSESGLHQNWMRDYDPTTGRYMQADPSGLVDGASVYGYALQNPGRYIDPRGEQEEAIIGGGVGIGAAALCTGPQATVCIAVAACGGIAAGIIYMATKEKPPQCSQCSEAEEGGGNIVFNRPPGYWPGDTGAAEWGRRNGIGEREGKNRFHGIKQGTPGSRGDDNYSANPETGDVVDENGESVGNLNDED